MRTFVQHLEARSFWSIAAGFASLAALTACSAGTGTTTATTSQALSEATASAADTQAAAAACFTAFEACKSAATAEADEKACRTTLAACLPAEANPGPHCGGGRGDRRGDHDGPDHDGPDHDGPDHDGPGPKGGERAGGDAGALPGFCKDVPLPPPAAIAACKAPLDACLSAGTDKKTCFDGAHACMKAAFDAALPSSS
jgi:hypothetical protein